MPELNSRIKCPMGCVNSNISESVKTISTPNSNLLLETGQAQKVHVYTCGCCGNIFEINQRNAPKGKSIL